MMIRTRGSANALVAKKTLTDKQTQLLPAPAQVTASASNAETSSLDALPPCDNCQKVAV